MDRHTSLFKQLAGALLAGAAALLAAPASAGVIDFNSQPPVFYNGGELFNEGGLTFHVQQGPLLQALGMTGVSGEILDGANPFTCVTVACPSGNASQFYAGENDGSVTITRGGGFFSLGSLRYAFVAPVGNLPDGVYGQLVLNATLTDGSGVSRSADFAPQDSDGIFTFADWTLDADFAAMHLRSLSISACIFDGNGGCQNSVDFWPGNLAQFAIDDLAVSVPLPGSAPLMLLGLASLGLIRRRRAN